MNVILGDLRANDYFNIISFSDTVSVWRAGGSIQATAQNVHSAKNYLGHMEADGCVRPTHPYGQAEVIWEILERLPSYPHLLHLSQCLEYHYYILYKYVPCVLFPSGKNIADSPCILGHIPLWTGVSSSLKHMRRRIC